MPRNVLPAEVRSIDKKTVRQNFPSRVEGQLGRHMGRIPELNLLPPCLRAPQGSKRQSQRAKRRLLRPPQVVSGEPVWSLEALLQAAAKVAGATHPGPKAPSLNVMALKKPATSVDELSMFALIDSGATHALRKANSQEEWSEASPVIVNL